MCLFCSTGKQVYAENLSYIPYRNIDFMKGKFPKLGMNNLSEIKLNCPYTFEDYGSPSGIGQGKTLLINMQGTPKDAGGRYYRNNFGSIKFSNIGTIFNRQMDLEFVFDSVSSKTGGNSYWNLGLMTIPLNPEKEPTEDSFPWSNGYYSDIILTFTTNIYWHGTNERVPYSFYNAVGDIDVNYVDGGQVFPESVWCRTGFEGDTYLWSDNQLNINEGGWDRWFQARPNSSSNGENSWYKTGVICPTSGATFQQSHYVAGCGTYITVGSGFMNLDYPSKTVSAGPYYNGSNVEWQIAADVLKFYVDGFSVFDSFVIEDTLQPGQTYKSAKVTKGGVDVTNQGTLTYDGSTRTVKFTFKPSVIANKSFYDGNPAVLHINTVLDSASAINSQVSNKGKVYYNGNAVDTTEPRVNITYRLTTSKEGNGTISPSVSQIPYKGNTTTTFTPAEGHYLKKIIIDGSTEIAGQDVLENAYKISGYTADHTIHAVFEPLPNITLRKEFSGNNVNTLGNPEFMFSIEGTDIYGMQHKWSKTIHGSGEITWQVQPGNYKITELPVDRYTQQKIQGILNADTNGNVTTVGGNADIKFSNSIKDYEHYSQNNSVINNLK